MKATFVALASISAVFLGGCSSLAHSEEITIAAEPIAAAPRAPAGGEGAPSPGAPAPAPPPGGGG